MGSALFHPQGSGGIGYVARPEKLSFALTLFNISGTAGVLVRLVLDRGLALDQDVLRGEVVLDIDGQGWLSECG